ncbi:MAG TPA: tetratricopeptide repeat protein, partial [Polyangiaceae bacterium]|nr:tetratricopeptide repeat protein [Polyangiaceae bacterium]
GLGQANVAWNDARKALVLGNIDDAHRSLCESSLIHAEGLGVEGLVELLLSKHAPEQAATWMALAKKARPDRRKTLDLEGDVLSQQGKVDDARASWAQALNVSPSDDKATKGIGDHYETEGNTFLKSENWAKAEIMYRRAATLNPKSAGAAAGLARTLLAQGYNDHAKLWSDTALGLQPDLGLALVVRADLILIGGDQPGALELYKQALKTDPGNPRAHQQIFRLTEQK